MTDYVAEFDDYLELGLTTDFAVANNLHVNFYEDWLAPRMVGRNAELRKAF